MIQHFTIEAKDLATTPMLLSYFMGGVATAVSGLPSLVSHSLGPATEWVWLVMLIGGPVISMVGIWAPNQWSGAWLRIAGGLACIGALSAFALSAFDEYGWATLTAWITSGLTVSSALVVAAEMVSMRRAAILARAMEGR